MLNEVNIAFSLVEMSWRFQGNVFLHLFQLYHKQIHGAKLYETQMFLLQI